MNRRKLKLKQIQFGIILITMTIIGLCGYKGSGKDTVADYLVQNYDNFLKISFADFIRNALKVLFDWDDDNFSPERKEIEDLYWGVTPRKMCQEIGTEFLRLHCKDIISQDFKLPNGENYKGTFHIKRINKEVINILNSNSKTNIIFSDIRFQDELDYVKKIGGKVLKVKRDGIEKNQFSNHISEIQVDNLINVDYNIENNQSIPDLRKRIDVIVEYIEAETPH